MNYSSAWFEGDRSGDMIQAQTAKVRRALRELDHDLGDVDRLGQLEGSEIHRAHGVEAVSAGGAIALRFRVATRAQMIPTS